MEFFIGHSLPWLSLSVLELSKLQYYIEELEKELLNTKSLTDVLSLKWIMHSIGSCLVIINISIGFVVLFENLLVADI
jgi:hypothetical protein